MNLPLESTDARERWVLVKEVFGDALAATPDDRSRLLDDWTRRDADIAREVESLLAAHDDAGDRFKQPPRIMLDDDDMEAGALTTLEGQRLGAYVVGRKIGEGGMGAVYEAVRADDAYRQRVALKTISRGANNSAIVHRFRRERQILAGLHHANIATLLDGGVTDTGTPYLVMEYVEGLPIDVWCRQKRLTIPQRLDFFRQACAAVQHAHRQLVVHRDIKPGNVMVSVDGAVKLLDFGIAKLLDADTEDSSITESGVTPLTTAYASPEQVRGENVSTATDVYSLGVLLFQLLAGAPPINADGKTRAQLLTAVVNDLPTAPSVACTGETASACGLSSRQRLSETLAGELDAIVLMALRKEPDRRYASVEALSDDIHRYLKGLPVQARPDTLRYRARKFVSRRRAFVVAAAVMAMAVASGTGIAIWQARVARIEVARTKRIAEFMQAILGAADLSATGDRFARIGPRATVSALLDSAVRRVSVQFPDDPGVRARLYTTIGSGYITQNRLREASTVLDSAMRLARATDEESALLFATASLQASNAALLRNRSADATVFAGNAWRALDGAGITRSALNARVYVMLASIALLDGDLVALDTMSRHALAMEDARIQGPSVEKAGALAGVAEMEVMNGHLARGNSMLLRATAMLDSLHVPASLERVNLLGDLTSVAIQLNQGARADSLARVGMVVADQVLGPDNTEVAVFQSYLAILNLSRGDTVLSRSETARAVRIVDSIPEVVWPVRYLVHSVFGLIEFRSGRIAAADSVFRQILTEVAGIHRGASGAETHLRYGITRALLRDFVAGEQHLRIAQQLYDTSGFVAPAMQVALYYQLAQVCARQGKDADAERLYAHLTPKQVADIKAFVAKEHRADQLAMAALRPASPH